MWFLQMNTDSDRLRTWCMAGGGSQPAPWPAFMVPFRSVGPSMLLNRSQSLTPPGTHVCGEAGEAVQLNWNPDAADTGIVWGAKLISRSGSVATKMGRRRTTW